MISGRGVIMISNFKFEIWRLKLIILNKMYLSDKITWSKYFDLRNDLFNSIKKEEL